MIMSPEQVTDLANDPAQLAAVCAEEPADLAPLDALSGTLYALQRLQRLAATDPAVLDAVALDLAELHCLAVPVAEAVEELL